MKKSTFIKSFTPLLLLIWTLAGGQVVNQSIFGNFGVYAPNSKFNQLQIRIPELICAGIFNRTGFIYVSGDTIAYKDSTNLNPNQYVNAPSVEMREKLVSRNIFYYLNGSYSELNDNFYFDFEISDARSGKAILKYKSDEKSTNELYKEIDRAALYLNQQLTINGSGQKKLKNIIVLNYFNNIDGSILKNYDLKLNRDFPSFYISQNLKGIGKSNITYIDNLQLDSHFSNKRMFDSLNADMVITGYLENDKSKKKCTLQSKLYIKSSLENTSVFDTILLPELYSGYYFLSDLPKKATDDLQNFINSAISDSGTWSTALLSASKLSSRQLIVKSEKSERDKDYNLAFLYAFFVSQKKDSSSLGYLHMGNVERVRKNFDASITYYDRALRISPTLLDANYNKALSLYNTGLDSLAILEFNKCKVAQEGYPKLHYWLASCYFNLGNEKAFQEARLALKYNSDTASVYELLGRYYVKMGTPFLDSAINYYNLSVKFCKGDSYNCTFSKTTLSKLHYLKGYNLTKSDQYRQSLPSFFNALRIDSTNGYAINQLRFCYTKLIKPDSVNFYLRLGFKQNIWDTSSVYLSQAEDYRYVKDSSGKYNTQALNEALNVIEIFELKSGETTLSNRLKGSTYFRLNNWDKAVLCYKKALKIDPARIINYLNLAEVQIMNDQSTEALKTFDTYHENGKITKAPLDEEEVVFLFLQITAKIIVGQKPNTETAKLQEILKLYNLKGKENVFVFGWSFATFQRWLSTSQMDNAKKKDILKLLESLRPYTSPELMLPFTA